ncbi:hypothetical protein [Pedobacter sp.]
MNRLLTIISFFLCNTACIAQETISIHLKDQHSNPVPFYAIENVKFKEYKYLADSLGNAKIPYIKGMAYKIHALGFADTIITIQQKEDLVLMLNSNSNLLKEIVIKAPIFSARTYELKAERTDQVNYYTGRPDLNHEIGRIVIFNKKIWFQKAGFKLKSRYNLNFKKDIFINIYKMNEKFEKELKTLKTKKPWYYQLISSPDLVFSSHTNDNYDVHFENNYLTFDLSRLNLYLEEGKYVITIELMAGRALGIRSYFSRQKEFLTLRSNNNATRVAWATELAYDSKKYANVIADFTYKERVESK